MKKIATSILLLSLSTQVFALSSEEALEYKTHWGFEQPKAQAWIEGRIGNYNKSISATQAPLIAEVCSLGSVKESVLNSVSLSNYTKERYPINSPKKFKDSFKTKLWLEVFSPSCQNYVSNYVGSEIDLSLRDSSGLGSKFGAVQYCNNYSDYLSHIKSSNENLQIAFVTFISRVPMDKIDFIETISENKLEIKAHAVLMSLARDLYLVGEAPSIDPFTFINIYMNENNKGSKRGIGGNDLELKQFLAAVISKNFHKADKILKKHIKQSKKIVEEAQVLCNGIYDTEYK